MAGSFCPAVAGVPSLTGAAEELRANRADWASATDTGGKGSGGIEERTVPAAKLTGSGRDENREEM